MDFDELKERRRVIERSNGLIACKACRKAKRYCDRKLPCSPCVERGLGHLCPNGAEGQRHSNKSPIPVPREEISRLDPSAAQIWDRLALRIHALEDALLLETRDDHALLEPTSDIKVSSKSLIRLSGENLLPLGYQMGPGTLVLKDESTELLGAVAADNLFMLDLFGGLAESETDDGNNASSRVRNDISPEILAASEFFPFGPVHQDISDSWLELVNYLPPYERAMFLIERYEMALHKMVDPVPSSQIDNELLPKFYPENAFSSSADSAPCRKEDLHDLALLFAILSIGSSYDESMPVVNAEGETFACLSLAALSFYSVIDHASLSTVQAIFILGSYGQNALDNSRHSDASGSLLNFGFQLALSIGLHIDPTGWRIEEYHANLRRIVFWEIFLADKWRSLRLGRPPSICKESSNCELPFDEEPVERVRTWRYRFARDVMVDIAELLCSAEVLPYVEVEKLNAKLQAFPPHPGVADANYHPHKERALSTKIRDEQDPMLTLFDKQIATQSLHKHYFAAAMLDQGISPFEGPYALSVLATYRSAVVLQHMLAAYVPSHPTFVARLPYVGKMSLVNGFIIGVVACQSSSPDIAGSASAELEKTIKMFEENCHWSLPGKALEVLYRLRCRAQQASHDPESSPLIDSLNILRIMAGMIHIHRTSSSGSGSSSSSSSC